MGNFTMVRKLFTFRRRPTPEKWTEEWVDQTYANAIEKIRRFIAEKIETLPPDSKIREDLERLHDLPPETLLNEISSRAYRNPERVGCPPYRVLMGLATRRRGLDDPVFEHIHHCHPCGAELGRMVRAFKPPNPS
jgi:hypothetical protein